jgi:pyrimidine operon attenuation protein/uracil phosphoribosyltransferase
MDKNYIFSSVTAEMKMKRMAYEIIENNRGESHIILAGIRDNGSVIAEHLRDILREISDISIELIHLAFNKKNPGPISLSRPLDFTDKVIILVDDVTNSGKTLLYGLKPFLDYYPRKIQTLVLVERTHKTYPIHPDYVGLSLATTIQEHISVEVEQDRVTGAYLD